MSSRNQILEAARTALRRSGHWGERRSPQPPRDYIQRGEYAPGSPEVVEQFAWAVEDYGAQVRRVSAEEEVPGAITQFLQGVRSVVFPGGVPPSWIKSAITVTRVYLDSPVDPLPYSVLERVGSVATAATCAIAQTGTFVLTALPDEGRRAVTLIPDMHIVVIHAKDIYQSVPEAFDALKMATDRPLTWISGPSATSDIELSRVEGVHGPRALRVVIVEEEGSK